MNKKVTSDVTKEEGTKYNEFLENTAFLFRNLL